MADFVASVAALRSALETGFVALPLYWPNDPRDPSGEMDGWAYSEARLSAERQVCLGVAGERRHRDFGEFVVTVFAPLGSLSGTAETHAQSIRALFPSRVGDVVILNKSIGAGRRVEGPNGRWYAVPVIISWQSDRIE